jgi:hypothetical protein
VVSGVCSGTASVQVVQVASPSANITPSGSTTFCDGASVVLDANAGAGYTYQWYNGSSPIGGATSSSYTATASGNYSVKVSAGNSCEATSSVIPVTVNPSPNVTVTPASVTSFCQGGSVQLNGSTGTGYTYQWYESGSPIGGALSSSYTATTSGSYTLTSTVGSCSRTSVVTVVTVLPNPVISITPAVSTINKFETQILTGNGAPNFDWGTQPGYVGSSGPNAATFQPLTTTTYNIRGWDNNGCENIGTATINVIGCGNVSEMDTTSYSPASILLTWKNPPGVTSDTIQYRKKNTTTWERIFVTGEQHVLNNLEPGTEYEYNIIPICTTTTVFIPSPIQYFTTRDLENGLYIRLSPNPVAGMAKLDIISANSFKLDIAVYDNTGKLVGNISNGENHAAGQVIKDINGAMLPNGIYIIGISINGKKENIKMVVAH